MPELRNGVSEADLRKAIGFLKDGQYEQGRILLRKLFVNALDTVDKVDLCRANAASPIVGDGPDQIKVASTISAIRDSLSLKTLYGYITRRCTGMDIVNAIENPNRYCSSSGKTKTGYIYGQPLCLALTDGEVLDELGVRSPTAMTDDADTTPTATEEGSLMLDTTKIDTATVNGVMRFAGLPTLEEIQGEMHRLALDSKRWQEEAERIKAELASRPTAVAAMTGEIEIDEGSLTFEIEMTPANEVLGIELDLMVPVFHWSAPHPRVPDTDPAYVFRPNVLIPLLFALIKGTNAWLYGHSGTGKTSVVEELCGRLGWPVAVISLDSEITRMDLVGRDTITTNDDGTQISQFIDGILPRSMSGPTVIVFDECDYGRGDVLYVLQRALENKGLLVTEDGGRLVHPHPWCRFVATANTKGTGDTSGLYPGARIQSSAFLNRFKTWIGVDYLDHDDEHELLTAKTGVPKAVADSIMAYVGEHRTAFRNQEVMQPISPRNILAWGEMYKFLVPLTGMNEALKSGLHSCVLNAASEQDSVILNGIADRTM